MPDVKFQFKGTPGPWISRNPFWFSDVEEQSVNSIDIISVADEDNYRWLGGVIGENVDIPRGVMQANAHLIAAAPELLHALLRVYETAKTCGLLETLGEEEHEYMHAAIHKALNLPL